MMFKLRRKDARCNYGLLNLNYLNILIFILVIFLLINISFISAQQYMLKVTDEHPFFVDNEWKTAKELKVGDELITDVGKNARITNIKEVNETVEVYNLEAEPYNDFVVDGDVVVHNSDAERFVITPELFEKIKKIPFGPEGDAERLKILTETDPKEGFGFDSKFLNEVIAWDSETGKPITRNDAILFNHHNIKLDLNNPQLDTVYKVLRAKILHLMKSGFEYEQRMKLLSGICGPLELVFEGDLAHVGILNDAGMIISIPKNPRNPSDPNVHAKLVELNKGFPVKYVKLTLIETGTNWKIKIEPSNNINDICIHQADRANSIHFPMELIRNIKLLPGKNKLKWTIEGDEIFIIPGSKYAVTDQGIIIMLSPSIIKKSGLEVGDYIYWILRADGRIEIVKAIMKQDPVTGKIEPKLPNGVVFDSLYPEAYGPTKLIMTALSTAVSTKMPRIVQINGKSNFKAGESYILYSLDGKLYLIKGDIAFYFKGEGPNKKLCIKEGFVIQKIILDTKNFLIALRAELPSIIRDTLAIESGQYIEWIDGSRSRISSRMTNNLNVNIPASLRDKLNIQAGDSAEFSVVDGALVIRIKGQVVSKPGLFRTGPTQDIITNIEQQLGGKFIPDFDLTGRNDGIISGKLIDDKGTEWIVNFRYVVEGGEQKVKVILQDAKNPKDIIIDNYPASQFPSSKQRYTPKDHGFNGPKDILSSLEATNRGNIIVDTVDEKLGILSGYLIDNNGNSRIISIRYDRLMGNILVKIEGQDSILYKESEFPFNQQRWFETYQGSECDVCP